MTVDHRLDAIGHRRTVGQGCGHAGQLLMGVSGSLRKFMERRMMGKMAEGEYWQSELNPKCKTP